jgi:hypothetical protein
MTVEEYGARLALRSKGNARRAFLHNLFKLGLITHNTLFRVLQISMGIKAPRELSATYFCC